MRLYRIMAGPLIGLAACVLLSSCAQPLQGGPLEWDQHLRHGKVLELLPADTAVAATTGCAAPTPSETPARGYAKVRYRGRRVHHVVVATLPDDVDVHVGDEVELAAGDCASGRLSRVERLVAAQAGQ